MTPLLSLVLGCLLATAQDDQPAPLRYLRPSGDKYVLESEISVKPGDRGTVYTSTTDHADEKMTLTLQLDEHNRIKSAEAVSVTAKGKRTATLAVRDKHAILKRGSTTDLLNRIGTAPVITTAPDWSDIIQLVTRYDVKKGGKQAFSGIWFHPEQSPMTLVFTVERIAQDKIKLMEQEITVHRHQIHLRGGDYLAWSDDEGRIVKILPRSQSSMPIVLEGYEEATRDLR
jgi:hypothetical protein